ncbi:unnamed protein product [Cladocopium goreaui]|uniref:Dimethylsulfonioproprionate lyase 3 (DMSP lyase 3) (Dimethylpropiothetin dethiomethylase 3) n=1 Tax=Cladocopium goreaui TaxID=2562237 RepID=A0A9P1CDK1_9DINO|nr:unnamed protein product [Cladocopium goreaui]
MIRAILLECTELPPYADALRYHTGLPVWDAITAADFYVSAFQDNPRFGISDWQQEWDGEQEHYELGTHLTKASHVPLSNAYQINLVSTSLTQESGAPATEMAPAATATEQSWQSKVIRLDYNYPPAPGDIDFPGSYDYDVLFRVVPGFTFAMAQSGKLSEAVEQEFIDAVRWLERKGVSGITGDCGFMMAFQPLASAIASVPVFMSAMMQCPMISIAFDKYDKILILTANGDSLKPQKETLLKQCGFNVDDRRFMWAVAGDMAGMGDAETSCQELIVGCQDVPGFDAVAKGEKVRMQKFWWKSRAMNATNSAQVDVEYVTPGIVYMARKHRGLHGYLYRVCLECTELPPYADALRSETKLPVFDAITNADCRGGGRGRGAMVEKSSGKAMDFLPWKLQIRWKFLDFLQGKHANLQKIPENSDVFSIFSQRM